MSITINVINLPGSSIGNGKWLHKIETYYTTTMPKGVELTDLLRWYSGVSKLPYDHFLLINNGRRVFEPEFKSFEKDITFHCCIIFTRQRCEDQRVNYYPYMIVKDRNEEWPPGVNYNDVEYINMNPIGCYSEGGPDVSNIHKNMVVIRVNGIKHIYNRSTLIQTFGQQIKNRLPIQDPYTNVLLPDKTVHELIRIINNKIDSYYTIIADVS